MNDSVLDARDVSVEFRGRKSLGRSASVVRAVDGVSLSIRSGETLALVGESGSGKSTTARAVLRLVPTASGEIRWNGTEITGLGQRQMRGLRPTAQMVFQDPYSSLNPAMTIGDIIAEGLEPLGLDRRQRAARVSELLADVGMDPASSSRYPYEFSGGQRQRVAIARAIASRPSLVVCDEAVSALDVSTQNQILSLLRELQLEHRLAYLFISHDLAVVRHVADRTAVMYCGQIVESGPTQELLSGPAHPFTAALVDAVPALNPDRRKPNRERLGGETPDPASPPTGCRFHPRCPYAMPVCSEMVPEDTHGGLGRTVRCHLHSPEMTGEFPNRLVAIAPPRRREGSPSPELPDRHQLNLTRTGDTP